MTDQATIDKLIEMRLTTMADAFRSQTMDPSMKGIPFEDHFGCSLMWSTAAGRTTASKG